jgi:hypothetical protein
MKGNAGFCKSRRAERFNLDAMTAEMAKTVEQTEAGSKGPRQQQIMTRKREQLKIRLN